MQGLGQEQDGLIASNPEGEKRENLGCCRVGWLRTGVRVPVYRQGRTGAGPTAHPPPGLKKFRGGRHKTVWPLWCEKFSPMGV